VGGERTRGGKPARPEFPGVEEKVVAGKKTHRLRGKKSVYIARVKDLKSWHFSFQGKGKFRKKNQSDPLRKRKGRKYVAEKKGIFPSGKRSPQKGDYKGGSEETSTACKNSRNQARPPEKKEGHREKKGRGRRSAERRENPLRGKKGPRTKGGGAPSIEGQTEEKKPVWPKGEERRERPTLGLQ